MKKLLVAAIGAATAFGAFAEYTNAQRFEGMERAETSVSALGSNWSEKPNSTNTYTIVEMETVGEPIYAPDAFVNDIDPTNALSVKTTFGKPLSFNVVSGGTPTNLESNLYFDSLVKFTVCDSTPDQTYDGAKIIMWLQENEAQTATNLYVRAGYLGAGIVTTNDYLCTNTIDGDFADKWHRVTIKAMRTISTAADIPGFAIFIDGEGGFAVASDGAKWANAPALTETADHYGQTKIFPSIIQDSEDTAKLTLTCASFDGTGTLNDMVFTSKAPTFAEDYVAPKASIVDDEDNPISGSPFTSLAAAVEAANGLTSGTYTFALSKGLVLDSTLVFTSTANIVFDFAGYVITNTAACYAITNTAGAITYTDSGIGGGITCTDPAGGAIYVSGGTSVTIAGGIYRSTVDAVKFVMLQKNLVHITGGSFAVTSATLEGRAKSEGKKFELNAETSLYDVVPLDTFTIKFVYGADLATTNTDEVTEGVTPTAPDSATVAVVGKTFTGWDKEIVAAVADATYTAQYTNNIYTITFVIGENSTSVQKEYGSEITSVPETPVRAGYTGAWDDNPAGDTVTGDKTYTYTYSAETYTITFVNEIGDDPAQTQYTIESGEIILPTATTAMLNVKFDGWTNATITAATTNFTPTVENIGTFTLYAKWSAFGSSGWDVDPDTGAGKTAAQEYEALKDTPLANADAPKLTTWATANDVTMSTVAEATAGSTTYDAYLLNCAPNAAAVEEAKEAFAIPSITFDEDGKPVIAAPEGSYNGTIQQKGSNDLSTWTVIDGSTYEADDFQFFKLELVP